MVKFTVIQGTTIGIGYSRISVMLPANLNVLYVSEERRGLGAEGPVKHTLFFLS
jgi:hypothetical protein